MIMKKILSILLLNLLGLAGYAQISFWGQYPTNNIFLYYFLDTGYTTYDWHYEPFKTDIERGGLKGKVVKVVTNNTDYTWRGYGETFTDTTYYNPQGNISKIVELKIDQSGYIDYKPNVWEYEYDAKGVLNGYTQWEESDSYDQEEDKWRLQLQKHVHIMEKDALGRIVQEFYPAYVQEEDGSWRQFSSGDEPVWTFGYDENGELVSGRGRFGLLLTYENGRLVKMYEENFKPVTFTYDAEGRLILFNHFWVDGWDDEYYYNEFNTELSYNDNGDIDMVVVTSWYCDDQWKRRYAYNIETYTFSYTYDAHGNWTEVVVNKEDSFDSKQIANSITREITYGDEAGINEVKRDDRGIDRWYNLNGQCVDNPKKGVYIQNGRKVVIK